jgi:VCBS repeat-containing protein
MTDKPGLQNTIIGTAAGETLTGTALDDRILAKDGTDTADGLAGDDSLDGGAGNDTIIGGAGNDWIIGNTGDDMLDGGAGADQFRFHGDAEPTTVTWNPFSEIDTIVDLDFTEGDTIELGHFAAGTFQGVNSIGHLRITPSGGRENGGATISSWQGLATLVAASDKVTASQGAGDTLLLQIAKPLGAVQTIAIQGGWSAYLPFNSAPIAADDSAAVLQDGSVSGFALPNDSDAEGGALRVSHIAFGSNEEAVASDGSARTIGGTYGSITIRADGSYSYAASSAAAQALAEGAAAQDVFVYKIVDSAGKSASARIVIDITGSNDGPVAKALAGNVAENGAALTLSADFVDADAGDTRTITVGTTGTVGAVSLNTDGTFSYNPNGKFEHLKAGQTATDTFTYTVTDRLGASSTETVTVTIVGQNDGPQANNDGNSTVEDAAASGNVLTNDSDPDGDTIRVSAIKAGGQSQAVATSGTTIAGTYGSITIAADGSYSYTANSAAAQALAAGAPAQETFTYTVVDSQGESATAQLVFNITGANDAPVVHALTGPVSENGPARTFSANLTDADAGDTHTVSVGTTGTVGEVTLNLDGTFSYNPNGKFENLKAGQTATDTFTYTVTDSAGASSSNTVTVTIIGENDNPKTLADFNGVVKNGKLSVTAANGVLANDSDVEGEALSVAGVNGGGVGTQVLGTFGTLVMKADGSYVYTANRSPGSLPAQTVAQDFFTYTVRDSKGGLTTETLTITVLEKGQTYHRGKDAGDALTGGTGSDVLDGGNGNDILIGNSGADFLIGAGGNDFLSGGAGADTFVFSGRFGADTITDFQDGLDKIQVTKSAFASFAEVALAAKQVGNDVVIDAGNGNLITIKNMLYGNLDASDLLFL